APSRRRTARSHLAHARRRSRRRGRVARRARRSNPRSRRRPREPSSTRNEATRICDILLQLADEVVRRRELDVGMQIAEEAELESLLIQVAFEVEQERLHTKLSAAKSRAVADRQRGDEVSLRRACATRVRAQ